MLALDPIASFPTEISVLTLSFLNNPDDLAFCRQVSTKWKKIASSDFLWDNLDLRKIFNNMTFFEEAEWEKYFFYKEKVQQQKKIEVIPILKNFMKYVNSKTEMKFRCLYFLMPAHMTISKMIENEINNRKSQALKFCTLNNSPISKTQHVMIMYALNSKKTFDESSKFFLLEDFTEFSEKTEKKITDIMVKIILKIAIFNPIPSKVFSVVTNLIKDEIDQINPFLMN